MQLYYSPASPFVRMVRVVLVETGQADAVELVESHGTALDADRMSSAVNPLGKIPALVRADGPSLYDSRVICQYLDTLAGTGLYPDGPSRWDTLVLESTAIGMMDAAVLMTYERRIRPEELVFEPWIEGQWNKVARALDVLESRWMSHLHGPLEMGQLATGCALGYLDLRHDVRNWREGRPSLAAWYDKIAQRDSFLQTAPV